MFHFSPSPFSLYSSTVLLLQLLLIYNYLYTFSSFSRTILLLTCCPLLFFSHLVYSTFFSSLLSFLDYPVFYFCYSFSFVSRLYSPSLLLNFSSPYVILHFFPYSPRFSFSVFISLASSIFLLLFFFPRLLSPLIHLQFYHLPLFLTFSPLLLIILSLVHLALHFPFFSSLVGRFSSINSFLFSFSSSYFPSSHLFSSCRLSMLPSLALPLLVFFFSSPSHS